MRSTGFVRRSHLQAWVRRIGKDADLRDCYLVAKAIAVAVRHRIKPGDAVTVDRICEIAKTTRHETLRDVKRLCAAGRLVCAPHWQPPAVPGGKATIAAFDFTIPSAADEAARHQTARPQPLPPSAFGGVEIRRVPVDMRGGG
jgi:hypothetical protein